MAQYLQLNSPEYNELMAKPSSSRYKDVCICCLSQNVPLVILTTCKHLGFFEIFVEFKPEYGASFVCHPCHHFLTRIEAFKTQVLDSLKILYKQAAALKPTNKFRNLQLSKTDIVTTTDLKQEFDESKFLTTTNLHEEQCKEIITDVKIEHESCSDFEIEIPLSDIKKEINKKVSKKKKKSKVSNEPKKAAAGDEENTKKAKRTRSNLHEKYEGKIAIVTLTKEELMLEREAEAKKESYLKLPYKCEHCIVGFDHEATLDQHMKNRHEIKGPHVCEICKSVLNTPFSFKEHIKRHTRRYECQACGIRKNNVYSVAKHYNDEHGVIDMQFVCQICGFTTDRHRVLRYHRDKHKQKQQCSLCASAFVNSNGLRVHMLTVHKLSNRVYSCDVCGAAYKAKSGLAAHAASAHAPRTPAAYCAPCRTHFRTRYNLQHHLRTHSSHVTSQDKKFICTDCGQKFLTNSALQQHIDFVHLKSNKYECDKCNKVFKNSSGLKKHDKFVHQKLRPPRNKICDHCGRGFTTLTILQSHIRTHTGERPLRCGHCAATFAHSAALYTHTRLLHSPGKTAR